MAHPQKSAMDSYLSELTQLLTERQTLDRRISKVEKVLRGMIDLLDTDEEQTEYIEKLDDIRPPAGLTDAIQQVIESGDGKAFFPTEIRDGVKAYLVNHSNQMASVHTTLKRLVKSNWPFIEAVERDGRTAYRWVTRGEQMMRDMQIRAEEAKKKLAEGEAREQMREAGSEIGTSSSLETAFDRATARRKK
jgi:hypothetical protein